MADDTIWVRIKPHNEKKGQKLRRYSVMGVRFDESLGWYKVPKTIAVQDGRIFNFETYLKKVRVDNDDPDSPLGFDVMTEKEARKLDASEKKAAELRARAVDARPIRPVDMSPVKFDEAPNEEEPVAPVEKGEPEEDEDEEDDLVPAVELAAPAKRPRGRPRKNAA